MPSVMKQKYSYVDDAGDQQTVTIDYQVDRQGMFRALIPDFLIDTVKANKPPELSVASGPKWWRLEGPTLAIVQKAVGGAFAVHNEPQIVTERVIRYTWDAQAAFVVDENGVIAGNGNDYRDITGLDWKDAPGANWAKMRHDLSITFPADGGYSIRLFAGTYDKTTTTRGKAVKIEYSWLSPGHGGTLEDPGRRLNVFTHGGMKDRSSVRNIHIEEMPYSDEAARWFYNAMIGMCRMAWTIDNFFQDKEAMARAIATGGGPLMIGKAS